MAIEILRLDFPLVTLQGPGSCNHASCEESPEKDDLCPLVRIKEGTYYTVACGERERHSSSHIRASVTLISFVEQLSNPGLSPPDFIYQYKMCGQNIKIFASLHFRLVAKEIRYR